MTTPLISHPFRLTPAGSVATREDGDPDYLSERLALLILTRPGERVLVPNFGLRDPVFGDFDAADLNGQLEQFGPPVQISSVKDVPVSDTLSEVTVEFEPIEQDGEF